MSEHTRRLRLLLVQQYFVAYRAEFYEEICAYFDEVEIAGVPASASAGFKDPGSGSFRRVETPRIDFLGGRLYLQRGLVSHFLRSRPDILYVMCDFRALNFWILIVLARILRTPVYAHGQGVFNKYRRRNFPVYMAVMRGVIRLLTSYVCYTPSVRDQLIAYGAPPEKLSVMPNTIVNSAPIRPDEKTSDPGRLFFVGRLRHGVAMDVLFAALELLVSRGVRVSLDIIGDGEQRAHLEQLANERALPVAFHGAIYDNARISALSRDCRIGVYPGDAGLSVVHYMSLSLVPVAHDAMHCHMGPEPSYLEHGKNGALFVRGDAVSLADTLERLISDPETTARMAKAAFSTWQELGSPTMAQRLAAIMGVIQRDTGPA